MIRKNIVQGKKFSSCPLGVINCFPLDYMWHVALHLKVDYRKLKTVLTSPFKALQTITV